MFARFVLYTGSTGSEILSAVATCSLLFRPKNNVPSICCFFILNTFQMWVGIIIRSFLIIVRSCSRREIRCKPRDLCSYQWSPLVVVSRYQVPKLTLLNITKFEVCFRSTWCAMQRKFLVKNWVCRSGCLAVDFQSQFIIFYSRLKNNRLLLSSQFIILCWRLETQWIVAALCPFNKDVGLLDTWSCYTNQFCQLIGEVVVLLTAKVLL